MDINKLIRPHLLDLKPYSSARDEFQGRAEIYLDANENPFGSPAGDAFHRYPDPYQLALKEKISGIKGLPVSQIFLGNGSDEPIDLLIRAFCRPGADSIIIMPPTYGMYGVSAGTNDVAIKQVPLNADYQMDPDAVLEAVDMNTKIIFICSPNNPTGNSMDLQSIKTVTERFDGLVVVDEAYIDFADRQSLTGSLGENPNLVVLQTLSKAWGMAALRIGMAFASEEIIRVFNKIKPPYNISTAAQALALEALSKEDMKNDAVKRILEQRKWLCDALDTFPWIKRVFPSDANFLLVKADNARKVYEFLVEKKIIIRDRSNVQYCEGSLRITVGTEQENKILVETLRTFNI